MGIELARTPPSMAVIGQLVAKLVAGVASRFKASSCSAASACLTALTTEAKKVGGGLSKVVVRSRCLNISRRNHGTFDRIPDRFYLISIEILLLSHTLSLTFLAKRPPAVMSEEKRVFLQASGEMNSYVSLVVFYFCLL